jgi:hypothetical protein
MLTYVISVTVRTLSVRVSFVSIMFDPLLTECRDVEARSYDLDWTHRVSRRQKWVDAMIVLQCNDLRAGPRSLMVGCRMTIMAFHPSQRPKRPC